MNNLETEISQIKTRLSILEQNSPEIPYFYEGTFDFELQYGNKDDAGLDVPVFDERLINGELSTTGEYYLQPGERLTVKTGLYVGIPKGWYALADTRSGTSKVALDLLCRTIDSPYRGNIRLALINLNSEPVVIKNGSKICQIIILPHAEAQPKKCNSLEEMIDLAGNTSRGQSGWGSTGGGFTVHE